MKYVKIKVKHMLVFAGIIMIISILVNLNFAKVYYTLGNLSSDIDRTNAYYDKTVEEFPQEKESVYGQIKKLQNIIANENEHIYARLVVTDQDGGATTNGNTRTLSDKTVNRINEVYNQLYTYHGKEDYFDEYAIYTALVNWYVGNIDIVMNILEKYDFKNSTMKELKNLHLATMYIELGNMNEAKKIIELFTYEDNEYVDYWKAINNYYLIMNNKIEEARENLAKENKILNRDVKLLLPLNSLNNSVDQVEICDVPYSENNDSDDKSEAIGDSSLSMPRSKTNNTVNGKVLLNGKPYKNAIIYLSNFDGMSSNFGYIFEGGITAITNSEGEYTIENVPKGEYKIGIAVPWQRIKGKNIVFDERKYYKDIAINENDHYIRNINIYTPIEVEIKKLDTNKYKLLINHDVLDFDYYNIGLALIDNEQDIYNVNYYSDKIYTNEIVFDINKEKVNYFSLSSRSSNGIIDISTLLDPLYRNGQYAVWVFGSMKNHDSTSISNYGTFSNEPYTTLYVQGEEWTKADSLLLEEKFEEALEQYKLEIKEKPNDLHLLKTVAKMYMREWDNNDESSNKDYKKALEYLLKLEELINTNTIKHAIASCYDNEKDYVNAIDYYMREESDLNIYNIGDCYLYMNDFEKANAYYTKLIGSYLNDSCISKIISINLLKNNIEEIKKYSHSFQNKYFIADYLTVTQQFDKISKDSYEPFYKYINNGKINKAKVWLEDKDDDLAKLYKSIFVTFKDEDRDIKAENFMALYDNVKDKIIKQYMEYIGKASIGRYHFE